MSKDEHLEVKFYNGAQIFSKKVDGQSSPVDSTLYLFKTDLILKRL